MRHIAAPAGPLLLAVTVNAGHGGGDLRGARLLAATISVLAGAKVLGLPASPLLTAMHPVVAGLSVILWAFGTWAIPLLVGLGVWRHLVRRVPLRYDPGLWSMVFPLGMYCVASEALGKALHVNWLGTIGHDGTWVAFAVWAALFAAMLAYLAGLPRRHPAPEQRSA